MAVQLQTITIVDAFQSLSSSPTQLSQTDVMSSSYTIQLQITVHKSPLGVPGTPNLSHPESHIRVGFDYESLYTINQRVVLGEKRLSDDLDSQVGMWRYRNKSPA